MICGSFLRNLKEITCIFLLGNKNNIMSHPGILKIQLCRALRIHMVVNSLINSFFAVYGTDWGIGRNYTE